MINCLYCDILTGAVDATFVHRDDIVAVFMDIQPVNAGHVLSSRTPTRRFSRILTLTPVHTCFVSPNGWRRPSVNQGCPVKA